jgi:phage terminase small subunit
MTDNETSSESKVLTAKQQAFINIYMTNGFNATQAAIKAGYSKNGARQQGHALLTNIDISKEIQRLMREFAMPAEEVLTRLTEHADISTGVKRKAAQISSRRLSAKRKLQEIKMVSKPSLLMKS